MLSFTPSIRIDDQRLVILLFLAILVLVAATPQALLAYGLEGTGSDYWSAASVELGQGLTFGNALVTGDFDGDGFEDLALGEPEETVGGDLEAGAVYVLYGTASGLVDTGSQHWTQDVIANDPSEPGDHFGQALASGDFDGDGYDDLAIGAPSEDVNGDSGAGAVNVLYGSATGLAFAGAEFWHLDVTGVLGPTSPGDGFGYSLASGDFQNDGRDDLAIGRPGTDETVTLTNTGAVSVLHGSGSGLSAAADIVLFQAAGTTEDTAEVGDSFGAALTSGYFDDDVYADLAVGVPFEDVDGISNAGAVAVFHGSAASLTDADDQFWHRDVPSVLGNLVEDAQFGHSLASGDFQGDGWDDLAIGAPGGFFIAPAGNVTVLHGFTSGLNAGGDQQWGEDLLGGEVYEGGAFGWTVATGDFDNDSYDDLAVGAPAAIVSGLLAAGRVYVLYGSSIKLHGGGLQLIDQATPGVYDSPQFSDGFGFALAAGDFAGDGAFDLAIKVVDADAAVHVLYGSGPPQQVPALGVAGQLLVGGLLVAAGARRLGVVTVSR